MFFLDLLWTIITDRITEIHQMLFPSQIYHVHCIPNVYCVQARSCFSHTKMLSSIFCTLLEPINTFAHIRMKIKMGFHRAIIEFRYKNWHLFIQHPSSNTKVIYRWYDAWPTEKKRACWLCAKFLKVFGMWQVNSLMHQLAHESSSRAN